MGNRVLERFQADRKRSARSGSLFDRMIQTYGDSTFGHHALAQACLEGGDAGGNGVAVFRNRGGQQVT